MKSQFTVHKLNETGFSRAQLLAEKFSQLLEFCEEVGKEGRELSLAATKLEEACFFAKKSLALNAQNQAEE